MYLKTRKSRRPFKKNAIWKKQKIKPKQAKKQNPKH